MQIRNTWNGLPGNVRGGIYIVFSSLCFAFSILLLKIVGQNLHIAQILFCRQMIMGIIVLPLFVRQGPEILRTNRLKLQLLRIFFATGAMLCGFTAVIHLPLADVTAITFSKALFVTLLAVPFLGESLGWRRSGAAVAGFLGILIMINPAGGFGLDGYYSSLALVSAAMAATVMIILRLLSRHDSPVTIISYQIIFVGLIMIGPALYFWQMPTLTEWGLLVGIGVFSYLGQMCNILGFRDGEASAIIPMDYTRLIFATIFGIAIFSQWPQLNTVLGALIVVAASIYTLRRETQLARERNHELA